MKLAEVIQSVYPAFEDSGFLGLVLDSNWTDRELKQKIRYITVCLKQKIHAGYPKSIRVMGNIFIKK